MNKDNLAIIKKIYHTLIDIFIEDTVLYEKIILTAGRDNIELPQYAQFYSFNIYYWWKFYKCIADQSKDNSVIIDEKNVICQTKIAIQELQKVFLPKFNFKHNEYMQKDINDLRYRKPKKLMDLLHNLLEQLHE